MGVLARDAFEVLVGEALDELPPELMKAISNVQVVVQDLPGPEAAGVRIAPSSILLGLYTGIPLTQRGMGYAGVLPDRITIYQENIERVAGSPEAIRAQVRQTVIHEFAHHFGISDERLSELGW
ncbi:MAG TPA: metallopeptidase family protein [Actinomycetota bacterium]|nr:metallopeptidase family protein [Actinomycetota bacterium]